MEKLSPRCKLIILGAAASLVAAIAAAPAAPGIPFLSDSVERSAVLAPTPSALTEVAALPNCAGGGSLYCHRSGNLAGL